MNVSKSLYISMMLFKSVSTVSRISRWLKVHTCHTSKR